MLGAREKNGDKKQEKQQGLLGINLDPAGRGMDHQVINSIFI